MFSKREKFIYSQIQLGSACWWIMLSGGIAFVLHSEASAILLVLQLLRKRN